MNLHVYYGAEKRWDQPTLDRVQAMLGRECDFFDGLEAVFEYETQTDATVAVFFVASLGVRAEAGGVGSGPPVAAVEQAKAVMRRSYRRRMRCP